MQCAHPKVLLKGGTSIIYQHGKVQNLQVAVPELVAERYGSKVRQLGPAALTAC